MSIEWLEQLMYELTDFFMAPVIILLVLLFGYSLFALGAFAFQAWQRKRQGASYRRVIGSQLGLNSNLKLNGYPLLEIANANPQVTKDQLDVAALEILEGVRSVSRLAPMLGLIATMIPMGPALKSLADGNIQGISENLVIAFSAVIFGLVIASITFWIANIKKKWLALEWVAITPLLPAELNSRQSNSRQSNSRQSNSRQLKDVELRPPQQKFGLVKRADESEPLANNQTSEGQELCYETAR